MNAFKSKQPATLQLVASIFVVCVSLSTAARSQTVYRCANTYSQTPCEGAQTIDVSDPLAATQMQTSGKATKRDQIQAKTLERARLAQDRAISKSSSATQPPKSPEPVASGSESGSPSKVAHTVTPKPLKAKTTKTDGFVGQVPATKDKPGKKKVQQKQPGSNADSPS
jgi:hypothetical protein